MLHAKANPRWQLQVAERLRGRSGDRWWSALCWSRRLRRCGRNSDNKRRAAAAMSFIMRNPLSNTPASHVFAEKRKNLRDWGLGIRD